MRTFGFALSALLVAVVSVSGQSQSQGQGQGQVSSLAVIQAPVTNLDLGPRTLSATLVTCADEPTLALSSSPYRIIAAHAGTNHEVYAAGDIVVLNGGTPQGLMAGQRYLVRRMQVGLYGEQPGNMARPAIRTAGWLTVVAADAHFALARIDFACDTVIKGDYLDPFVETTLPEKVAADGPPNFNDLARVLFGADRRQTFGAGDLLSIDRGMDRALAKGTRVSFYRDRQNGTPLVEMGAGVVVDVSSDSAKVVVTRAREAVAFGDYVAIRGASAP